MYKPLDITTCPAAFCFCSSTLSSGGALVSSAPSKHELHQPSKSYFNIPLLVHFLLWQAAKPSGDKCTPLKHRPPSSRIA